MSRGARALALALVLAGWLPAAARAQEEVGVKLTVTVATVLYIDATNLDVTFTPSAAVLQSGSMVAPFYSVLTHAGNVRHSVLLRALAGVWTSTNGVTKPVGELQWSTNGGTSWTSFSTTNATPVSNAVRNIYTRDVYYRVLLDPDSDQPGTYTLDFQFTILPT
jgi:hypothetical protein